MRTTTRAVWPTLLGVVVAAYLAERLGMLTRAGDRVIDILDIDEPSGPRSPGEAAGNH